MRKPLALLVVSTALFAACSGGNSEDSKVTQTRLDDLDNIEGTISDEMVNTDESTDQPMIDNTPLPSSGAKPKADAAKEKKEATAEKPTSAPTPAPAATPAEGGE